MKLTNDIRWFFDPNSLSLDDIQEEEEKSIAYQLRKLNDNAQELTNTLKEIYKYGNN